MSVGWAGRTAYALTTSSRLRAWDLDTGAIRTLGTERVASLASDGTVALSITPLPEPGVTVNAWEPASGRILWTKSFANGLWSVLGVSPSLAVLEIKLVPYHEPLGGEPQVLPPSTEVVAWDLRRGAVESLGTRGCPDLSLSADGTRIACGQLSIDRTSRAVSWSPPLAPEWAPSPRTSDDDGTIDGDVRRCAKCSADDRSPLALVSTWVSRDGRFVYYTFRNTEGHDEWRLARWKPERGPKAPGNLERLATSTGGVVERVLGASRDGGVIVTADGRHPPVLRRAPDYAPATLPAPPASAAVFSDDDAQLVTGHSDGVLRLWDVGTGRLLAASSG